MFENKGRVFILHYLRLYGALLGITINDATSNIPLRKISVQEVAEEELHKNDKDQFIPPMLLDYKEREDTVAEIIYYRYSN